MAVVVLPTPPRWFDIVRRIKISPLQSLSDCLYFRHTPGTPVLSEAALRTGHDTVPEPPQQCPPVYAQKACHGAIGQGIGAIFLLSLH
jgi:hypothetical protein